MHPRCLVSCGEVEDCVGKQKFMLSTELQEVEAVAVTVSRAILTNDVFPHLVVCADAGIEVSK